MRLRAVLLVSFAAGMTSACRSETFAGPQLPALRAELVGSPIVAPINSSVGVLIIVTAADGRPVKGQIVNFIVTRGGGTVFGGVNRTNESGYAREIWTLGPVVGAQTLEARAVDSATGEKLTFGVVNATATP